MVATVGSIAIDLSTNVAKFASGFKSAATTVDRESGRMAKSIARVDRAGKAAGSVLSGFVGGIAAGGALAEAVACLLSCFLLHDTPLSRSHSARASYSATVHGSHR